VKIDLRRLWSIRNTDKYAIEPPVETQKFLLSR
jgi:hypothetical protein